MNKRNIILLICAAVLLVYLFIILRMIFLARFTEDKFCRLVIIGVVSMLLFHVFQQGQQFIAHNSTSVLFRYCSILLRPKRPSAPGNAEKPSAVSGCGGTTSAINKKAGCCRPTFK